MIHIEWTQLLAFFLWNILLYQVYVSHLQTSNPISPNPWMTPPFLLPHLIVYCIENVENEMDHSNIISIIHLVTDSIHSNRHSLAPLAPPLIWNQLALRAYDSRKKTSIPYLVEIRTSLSLFEWLFTNILIVCDFTSSTIVCKMVQV